MWIFPQSLNIFYDICIDSMFTVDVEESVILNKTYPSLFSVPPDPPKVIVLVVLFPETSMGSTKQPSVLPCLPPSAPCEQSIQPVTCVDVLIVFGGIEAAPVFPEDKGSLHSKYPSDTPKTLPTFTNDKGLEEVILNNILVLVGPVN